MYYNGCSTSRQPTITVCDQPHRISHSHRNDDYDDDASHTSFDMSQRRPRAPKHERWEDVSDGDLSQEEGLSPSAPRDTPQHTGSQSRSVDRGDFFADLEAAFGPSPTAKDVSDGDVSTEETSTSPAPHPPMRQTTQDTQQFKLVETQPLSTSANFFAELEELFGPLDGNTGSQRQLPGLLPPRVETAVTVDCTTDSLLPTSDVQRAREPATTHDHRHERIARGANEGCSDETKQCSVGLLPILETATDSGCTTVSLFPTSDVHIVSTPTLVVPSPKANAAIQAKDPIVVSKPKQFDTIAICATCVAIHREGYTSTKLPPEFSQLARSTSLSPATRALLVEAVEDYNSAVDHNNQLERVRRMGYIHVRDVANEIIGDLLDDRSIRGTQVWREMALRLRVVTKHPMYPMVHDAQLIGSTLSNILAMTKRIVMYDGANCKTRHIASKSAARRLWDDVIPIAMAAVAEQWAQVNDESDEGEEESESAEELGDPSAEAEDWQADWAEELAEW